MEVVLEEAGVIRIASAKLVDDGIIEIQACDSFKSISRTIIFPVRLARLEFCEDSWYFTASLEIPEKFRDYIDDCCVFDIENQSDIYRLNALL